MLDNWISLIVELGSVIVLAALGILAVQFGRTRLARALEGSSATPTRRKQWHTVVQVVSWVVNASIVIVAVMMLLSRFVDIAPLLASLGVVGLALSLGAQTLIKDLIGGMLILIENQYAIGDVIQVGDIAGSVEHFTLRVTHVRSVEGKLHVVPNGEIRIVSNITRHWSRAMVDLGVAYEEDLDRVLAVLEREAAAFAQDPEVADQLIEAPSVIGPLSLGDWAVTVRVMVKTLPGKHWGVGQILRRRLLAACERERITLPYPRQEVLVRDSSMHEA
ncbi:MAG: mechanosensitive ion channel family protein [Anaerolineae bacterium]